MVSEKKEKVRY